MSDPAAVARVVRDALARPRDLALAASLPAPMELAIALGDAPALEWALPELIGALAPLGIARTHLEVVLGCDASGAARRATCVRLRAALAPTRVHAHDARHDETFVAARLDGIELRLDDALRESEGLVLVIAARPGSRGDELAGETIASLADQPSRVAHAGRLRAVASALPIDLALVIETGDPPRAWVGTGRWLLAERFPPAS